MTRLGVYERVLLLGEGGMGTVWLARTPAGDYVAVKTLKDEHAADPRVRSMFLKEIRLASAIRHPNVVSVVATGEDAGVPYFVMEWVHGRSIRALAPSIETHGGVPLDVALRIAIDACAGLHAAHEAKSPEGHPLGLVHRDVTPHNLLVAATGVTKVIDFGVAKAREVVGSDTTSSGGVKGKVRYMAPEQALARPLDRRADVFALGAVLYELVVGRPPFEGPNDLAILRSLLGTTVVDVPSWVPTPITTVLQKALARRAEDRFASTEEMGGAIARAMFELGLSAGHLDVARWVSSLEPELAAEPRFVPTLGDADPTFVDGTPTPFVAVQQAEAEAAAAARTRGRRLFVAVAACAVLGLLGGAASFARVSPAMASPQPAQAAPGETAPTREARAGEGDATATATATGATAESAKTTSVAAPSAPSTPSATPTTARAPARAASAARTRATTAAASPAPAPRRAPARPNDPFEEASADDLANALRERR